MKKLVIVESPTKAKTINKYLGDDYIVKASMGHVRDLYPSRLSVDVKHDFEPKYTIIKGKEKLVTELKKTAQSCDEVYLATDPDREGEAIAYHLAVLLDLDIDKTKRVKFTEINKRSVTQGISNPEKIDTNLFNAQQSRRILDRLVGYKLSPFISQKIRRGLSAGRVQSVAVRLIVDREEEINAFTPEEYWSLTAKLTAPPARKQFKANLVFDENGKIKISNRQQADAYLARLDNAIYTVDKIKKGSRKRQPSPPFTTSTLQQEASHKLGFPSNKTMKIAQELYEGVEISSRGSMGLITYMRTDSLRISPESREEGKKYIAETYGEKYLPEKDRFYKNKNKIQDGHEAIRPTMPSLTPVEAKSSLSNDQFKLYDLIWKRFISSLMECCVQSTRKAEIKASRENDESKYSIFTLSGYTVTFDGYTRLYTSSSDELEKENEFPDIKEGQLLKLKELVDEQHFTQPLARYTEASLIKMLEETGIGRPSTYATIISTITAREYVAREQKQLKPTELGCAVTKLLKQEFPKIVNTKFTAGMESDLDKIEAGELDYVVMLHEFYGDFEKTLKQAKEDMDGVKIELEEDKTDILCDKCSKHYMVVKVGRFGKFLACPGYPECKNTKPFVEETKGKCPVCGKAMIGRKSRKGHTFYGCTGYPDCTFMSWDLPVDDICPKCGKTLFKTKKNGLRCLNEGCDYVSSKTKSKKETENKDE